MVKVKTVGISTSCMEICAGQAKYPYIKVSSEQIPQLMNIQEDYKNFKIIHISEDTLILQFDHKQFSNATTRITDYYVPEHVSVENRDFHW